MSVKHALIGGGTGFIGQNLCNLFMKSGWNEITLVSRMPGAKRITWHELEKNGIPNGVTDVINLAGQNILDPTRLWTAGFKQNVWNSRINTTSTMAKAVMKSPDVKSFTVVTGISGYKPNEKIYKEDDKNENFDFMSNLCIQTENASILPKSSKCRRIVIRSGVVLGRGGGMIQSIYLPFMLFLGGPMGTGKQILPWIHMDDLCRLILFCINSNNLTGVFNGVAPDIITNELFSKTFASCLGRPSFLRVPEMILTTIFGKERAVLILQGAKVMPQRALDCGFEFKYPTIMSACQEIAKK